MNNDRLRFNINEEINLNGCEEHKTERDDQIARPRRAQTCERSELRAIRMCPRSGQIFLMKIERLYSNTRQLDKNQYF